MAKKIVSVALAVIMLFACAMPAFASDVTSGSAIELVKGRIWAKNDNTTFTSEDEDDFEDYRVVTVVNHGVTFVFHVSSSIAKPKLESYEIGEDTDSYTFISIINAVLLKIASFF